MHAASHSDNHQDNTYVIFSDLPHPIDIVRIRSSWYQETNNLEMTMYTGAVQRSPWQLLWPQCNSVSIFTHLYMGPEIIVHECNRISNSNYHNKKLILSTSILGYELATHDSWLLLWTLPQKYAAIACNCALDIPWFLRRPKHFPHIMFSGIHGNLSAGRRNEQATHANNYVVTIATCF